MGGSGKQNGQNDSLNMQRWEKYPKKICAKAKAELDKPNAMNK